MCVCVCVCVCVCDFVLNNSLGLICHKAQSIKLQFGTTPTRFIYIFYSFIYLLTYYMSPMFLEFSN